MKVLVAGGTGWVGHNIALAFTRAGHEVTVFTRGREGHYGAEVAFLPRATGDKKDETMLKELLSSQFFDVVIDSVPHPDSIALLGKMPHLYGRYLHCGSTGVYTPLQYLPGDENHPFGRPSFKGFEGKAAADAAGLELAAAGKLKLTILRPCCIAGPGKPPLDNLGGRREDFISDLAAGKPLDLLNDGSTLIQVVHIRDLARAFVLAAERPETIGRIYNICSAKAVTVKRYCELNAEALGKKATFNYLPFDDMIARHGEAVRDGLAFLAEHMCFDIAKARRELGYQPEYSPEAAIRETAGNAK